MNKIMKALVVGFAIVLSFFSNSCDKFDTFPLNIPFSVTITTQGSNNPSTSSSQYCLSQSETYQDYVEDIEKLTFVQAAWRTDSVKNISSGDVEITVSIVGGATLFHETLTNINPADYQSPNSPFVFSLTDSEIQALNNYLNSYLNNPNQCLEAEILATVDSGTPPYYLKGI